MSKDKYYCIIFFLINDVVDKDLLVAMIVSSNKEPSEKILKFVKEYMETIEGVEKVYVKYSEYFMLNLPVYKIEWKQVSFIANSRYKSFYDFIEKNNMINLNINLINVKLIANFFLFNFYLNCVVAIMHIVTF